LEGEIFPDAPRITQMIMEMLEDLGLKKPRDGRGPHTFRHYLATRLFYVGNMRIEDIAFLLGDTTETIVNNYLDPTPLMLRERVSRAMRWEE
jgi:integrase